MKKLLMGSIALLIFSLSILVFQISCQKTSTAQTTSNNYVLPPATTSTLGGVIIGSGLSVNSSGILSANSSTGLTQLNLIIYDIIRNPHSIGTTYEAWMANIDGSNPHQILMSLAPPSGLSYHGGAQLSPDGKTVILPLVTALNSTNDIILYYYSCSIDGSNLKKIIDASYTASPQLNGIY
jgi:hypothetical protein